MASDCPMALTEFRENDIRPRICSRQTRSVSICCKKESLVSPFTNQRCGLRDPFIQDLTSMSEIEIVNMILVRRTKIFLKNLISIQSRR